MADAKPFPSFSYGLLFLLEVSMRYVYLFHHRAKVIIGKWNLLLYFEEKDDDR